VAQLAVIDNGPGIPAERLELVFQPFVSGKTKGMGLGLAICKEIVEGHGGRIEVDSRPGAGTVFRILLPVHAPQDAPVREALQGGAL
jgi:signal transduction histidine kinase